jgi:nucleoid-associated protein YgaU
MKQQLATLVFMIAMAAGFISCSGNDTKNAQSTEAGQNPDLYSMDASPDDIQFDDEGEISKAENSETQTAVDDQNVVAQENASTTPAEAPAEDPLFANSQNVESPATVEANAQVAAESVTETEVSSQSQESLTLDDLSVYRVQDDKETLMMIAFKIYGDYMKWKEIADLNKEMFDHRYVIKKGMMLKFKVPQTEFKWTPKGEPYLIDRGETLSLISQKVYDTANKWKKIYNNNRPLIRHPDKIFAGFTIYYVPQGVVEKNNTISDTVLETPKATPEVVTQDVSETEAVSESVSEEVAAEEVAEGTTQESSGLRAKKRNPTSL